jgi:DNA modification methylase
MIQGESYTVHIGNNLNILPTLPDNSVDSIVTDPPYELGFMGKKWDSSGIAYSVELWRECLRVLKPGGHLLSFGGTRTWHRVAVGIEDAGFEVRDSIAWMYGSGFPKSLDVSKAIDKSDATEARRKRDFAFTSWMRSTSLTASKANQILQDAGLISSNGTVAGHYFAASPDAQPAVATAELFDKLRPYLPEVPDYIEKMVAERTIESENFKNREVIGSKTAGMGSGKTFGMLQADGNNAAAEKELDITAPSTPEAQQWEGWGTALKPAFEPIVVARKPLIGTVAENVLTHGTGALNIDGSRIGTETIISRGGRSGAVTGDERTGAALGMYGAHEPLNTEHQGRWPANVILDEYSAEVLDEQSGVSKSVATNRGLRYSGSHGGLAAESKEYKEGTDSVRGHSDSGGASRFYYVAKASKRDRNEGLDELPEIRTGAMSATADGSMLTGSGNERTTTRQNFHPTVKPTQLMRYLVKLVTPPGGTVLDPFTGSGSTGKAAILEGFRFIGCELTEDYIPIIEGRLKHAESMAAEVETKKDEALF